MSIKTVEVTFNTGIGNKSYHYLTEFDVSVGDTCVVDSPTDGLVTVTVKKVYEEVRAPKATKFVVDVVDGESYKEQVSKHELRKEILLKLEVMRKEVEELAVYEYLSKNNGEAAKLLEQLKELK